ncbi:FolC bifunctional protein [Sodiomyces alkalinus F11]|uniref:Folylpolyglutamate synthase n=1 Tax=Sodiomyces alkalinus (strain CBS 110278 / VKM F-3762 / F11) TaxID=1314773 RepID=A0A3N2PYR1_SODAK|nr:FolC bifunctional protein [Sodiomyces alkalinus F11]ROT39568.1 FolC bifunctional protein [Sodiomyces alkalinus F11]
MATSSSAEAGGTGRTYQDALTHLNLLIPNRTVTALFDNRPQPTSGPAPDPNLQALPEMLTWLRRAGYTPSDLARLRCIHVAGTKGKGSTCAYLTSLLVAAPDRRAGRVGTYTSPHLVTPRERIALDGRPIGKALFARYFFEVWDRLTDAAVAEGVMTPEAARGAGSKPFYFRFLTLLAFHVFLSEGVRSAVVEVGIGGAYDATNVLPPEAVTAAVITQLGVDHVAMLGDTPEKIAWHKAGVMKRGVPAFTRLLGGKKKSAGGGQGENENDEGVMRVLKSRAEELGCSELVEVRDEHVDAWGGVRVRGRVKGGSFQSRNQALAALAAEEHLCSLASTSPDAEPKATRKLAELPAWMTEAMKQTSLRGRQEVVEDPQRPAVRWLLDGAHTVESLDETAAWLAAEREEDENLVRKRRRFVLLFNQQEREAGKLLGGFLDKLRQALAVGEAKASSDGRLFDAALFSRNDLARSDTDTRPDVSVQESCRGTFASCHPGTTTEVCPDLPTAMDRVGDMASRFHEAGEETIVLVTGSLHLVGGVIRLLEPDGLD